MANQDIHTCRGRGESLVQRRCREATEHERKLLMFSNLMFPDPGVLPTYLKVVVVPPEPNIGSVTIRGFKRLAPREGQ